MRFFLRVLPMVLVAASFASPAVVFAQAWPSKPVRIVVPFPPGSVLDTMARMVQQKMSESVGQPVIVENRAGANGMIGAEFVAKSAPDGYTILATTPSTHIAAVYLVKKMPYDPHKDVTPITAAVDSYTVLAVNPSVPVGSAKELIAHLKQYPGKVAYGSPGVGNNFHLIGELFQITQGVKLLHVPYKGIVPAVQAAASGQVQLVFSAVNNTLPHVKSGKLKVLAILNPSRFPGMPDVPTAAEVLPGFERPSSWFGFLGPPGMAEPVLTRINAEIVKAIRSPDLKPKIDAMGLSIIANSAPDFAKMYAAGFEAYGKLVRAVGIKPE